MISFKSFEGDNNYLVIRRTDLLLMAVSNQLSDEISQVAHEMYFKLIDYERENKLGIIGSFAIRKDSILGQFLLNNPDRSNYINRDLLITYEDITNALNIAIFEDNEIYKEIIPLFRNREHDYKDELSKKYSEDVLDYILKNKDFGTHLEKLDGIYIKTKILILAYEDGKFVIIGKNDDNKKESSNAKKKIKTNTD